MVNRITEHQAAEHLKSALVAGFFEQFRRGEKGFQIRKAGAGGGEKGKSGPQRGLSKSDWKIIGRQVLILHEGYTRGGADFTQDRNPIHANAAGYQFYYLPRNFHRTFEVLRMLPWQNSAKGNLLDAWLPRGKSAEVVRILDIGCGTGAFSLAVLAWLAINQGNLANMPPVRLTLVDQSHRLLDLAASNVRALWSRLGLESEIIVEPVANGVEQFLTEPPAGESFHIAGAAMMLNELNLRAPRRSGKRALRFTVPFKKLLHPAGLGLMVEPGTRKGYMNLMLVREQIAGLPILYPCPHGKPCPMWNAKVSRWCHATVPTRSGFFFDEDLKRYGGMRFAMRDVNLIALAFQNLPQVRGGKKKGAEAHPAAPFQRRQGSRVVSGFIPAKKKKEPRTASGGGVVLICEPSGKLREQSLESGSEKNRYRRGMWLEDQVEERSPSQGRHV